MEFSSPHKHVCFERSRTLNADVLLFLFHFLALLQHAGIYQAAAVLGFGSRYFKSSGDAYGQFFVDDVRIWNVALTSVQF